MACMIGGPVLHRSAPLFGLFADPAEAAGDVPAQHPRWDAAAGRLLHLSYQGRIKELAWGPSGPEKGRMYDAYGILYRD